MERDRVERAHAIHRVQPEHHHPGDPEEQDVVARDQHGCRVVLLQVARVLRPAQRGERPQPRGEPGVEHVLVLDVARGRLLAGPAADDLAARPVPDRDAVAPPELAGDAPVVHVVDPREPARLQLLGVDHDVAAAHRVARCLGQRPDLDEPLQRKPRLDGLELAALGVADAVPVRLLGDDPALRPQRLLDRGAGREPVEAVELGAAARDVPASRP